MEGCASQTRFKVCFQLDEDGGERGEVRVMEYSSTATDDAVPHPPPTVLIPTNSLQGRRPNLEAVNSAACTLTLSPSPSACSQ